MGLCVAALQGVSFRHRRRCWLRPWVVRLWDATRDPIMILHEVRVEGYTYLCCARAARHFIGVYTRNVLSSTQGCIRLGGEGGLAGTQGFL